MWICFKTNKHQSSSRPLRHVLASCFSRLCGGCGARRRGDLILGLMFLRLLWFIISTILFDASLLLFVCTGLQTRIELICFKTKFLNNKSLSSATTCCLFLPNAPNSYLLLLFLIKFYKPLNFSMTNVMSVVPRGGAYSMHRVANENAQRIRAN